MCDSQMSVWRTYLSKSMHETTVSRNTLFDVIWKYLYWQGLYCSLSAFPVMTWSCGQNQIRTNVSIAGLCCTMESRVDTHTHTQCETHLFQHNYRLISCCNSFTILSQHFTSHRMSFLFSCHWPNFWTWLKSTFDSSSLLLISIAAQWRLINLVHRWLCTQLQKSLNK